MFATLLQGMGMRPICHRSMHVLMMVLQIASCSHMLRGGLFSFMESSTELATNPAYGHQAKGTQEVRQWVDYLVPTRIWRVWRLRWCAGYTL